MRGLRRKLRTRRRELEPPGEHRVHDDPVSIEVDLEEFARSSDGRHTLPDEPLEFGWGPPDGERTRGHRGRDRASAERRVERFGDDGKVGKFGHGCRS